MSTWNWDTKKQNMDDPNEKLGDSQTVYPSFAILNYHQACVTVRF